MNLDAYLQDHPPAARHSKFAPFLADIRRMRALGYTLAQICDYLAANDLRASPPSVSTYLRRQAGKASRKSAPPEPMQSSANAPIVQDAAPVQTLPSERPALDLQPRTRPRVDIDRIANQKVDLDALARLARAHKAEKPK